MHDAPIHRDKRSTAPGEADELKAAAARIAKFDEVAAALKEEIDRLLRAQDLTLNLSEGIDLPAELRKIEFHFIRSALKITGGHQTQAARLLGIKLTTLNQKLKKHGIDPRWV